MSIFEIFKLWFNIHKYKNVVYLNLSVSHLFCTSCMYSLCTIVHHAPCFYHPHQITDLDMEYQKYGAPQSSSTPDTFHRGPVRRFHSDNEIVSYDHVSGGKWSTNRDRVCGDGVGAGFQPPSMSDSPSESPFPPLGTNSGKKPGMVNIEELQEYYHRRGPQPQIGAQMMQHGDYGAMYTSQGYPCKQNNHSNMYAHNQTMLSPTAKSGDITKTTFTSKEHMEMHLNKKISFPFHRNTIADIDCSSIYPTKDFIERTAAGSFDQPCRNQFRNQPIRPQSPDSPPWERKRPSSKDNKDKNRPLKKRRTSKYSTEDLRVPPQKPLLDDTVQKYPALSGREDIPPSKHKYFVVNPSEVTNMAPKALITKYIDFLIQENEKITEISKLTSPPVDIYVTEDMYFMDTLKFKIPFPSRKFVEWVSNFYPCLNLHDMKFKGRQPTIPALDKPLLVETDTRPTQVILEDTFYYFQRQAMCSKSPSTL